MAPRIGLEPMTFRLEGRCSIPTELLVYMVGGGGFEPPKAKLTDLQSAPFDHSGILRYGVGYGTQTRDSSLEG